MVWLQSVYQLSSHAMLVLKLYNPNKDAETYQKFVLAAVRGSLILQCPVTPKKQQMSNIRGGLYDEMEDWIECLHQWGMQQHQCFCTVQNPLVRALVQARAGSHNTHPAVLAQVDATDKGNKQKLTEKKIAILLAKQKWQHKEGWFKASRYVDNIKEDKPGRRHYSAMGRSICMARILTIHIGGHWIFVRRPYCQ